MGLLCSLSSVTLCFLPHSLLPPILQLVWLLKYAATATDVVATTAQNIVTFAQANGFVGVDLDWEEDIDWAGKYFHLILLLFYFPSPFN